MIKTIITTVLVCWPLVELRDSLAKGFYEAPIYRGVTPKGDIVELLVSPKGTWSVVVIKPDGLACGLASGIDGQIVAAPKGPDS